MLKWIHFSLSLELEMDQITQDSRFTFLFSKEQQMVRPRSPQVAPHDSDPVSGKDLHRIPDWEEEAVELFVIKPKCCNFLIHLSKKARTLVKKQVFGRNFHGVSKRFPTPGERRGYRSAPRPRESNPQREMPHFHRTPRGEHSPQTFLHSTWSRCWKKCWVSEVVRKKWKNRWERKKTHRKTVGYKSSDEIKDPSVSFTLRLSSPPQVLVPR